MSNCPACGSTNGPDATFCGTCGTRFVAPSPDQWGSAPTERRPAMPPQPGPAGQPVAYPPGQFPPGQYPPAYPDAPPPYTAPTPTPPQRGGNGWIWAVGILAGLAVLGVVGWFAAGLLMANSDDPGPGTVTVAVTATPTQPPATQSAIQPTPSAPTQTLPAPTVQPTASLPTPWEGGPVDATGRGARAVGGESGKPCRPTGQVTAGYPTALCTWGRDSFDLPSLGGRRIASQTTVMPICQANLGTPNPMRLADQTNTWWLWMSDGAGGWDFFPETGINEGASDSPVNGVPVCWLIGEGNMPYLATGPQLYN